MHACLTLKCMRLARIEQFPNETKIQCVVFSGISSKLIANLYSIRPPQNVYEGRRRRRSIVKSVDLVIIPHALEKLISNGFIHV